MPLSKAPSTGSDPTEKDEFDVFLEEYNIAKQPRYPSSSKAAPPVDDERLRALARGELDAEMSHEVCVLIALFQTWGEAYSRILMAEPTDIEVAADSKTLAGVVSDDR